MEIGISSKGCIENGEIFISQKMVISEEGNSQALMLKWNPDDFERYLSSCYRVLKNVKIKMAEHDQEKEERINTGIISDQRTEVESNESSSN